MIHRIVSTEESEQMPPDKSLNQKEINTLKAWISEGAKWPKHWNRSEHRYGKTEMGATIDQIIAFKQKRSTKSKQIKNKRTLPEDCQFE